MVDIHSHIIFGVDDGPADIEASAEMVREAAAAGVKILVATPHYKKEAFDNEIILRNFGRLGERVKDLGISLRLGYEVLIHPFLPQLVMAHRELTLNSSGYLLLELPFGMLPVYTFDVIYKLQLINVTVILAHPERNQALIKNFDILRALTEKGCLIQVDAASITGAHGRNVRGMAKKIIRSKLANFVASDAHRTRDYGNWFKKAYGIVEKWSETGYARRLFMENGAAMFRE